MSITLFSGTVGSGKSLHAAEDIKEKLRWGRYVISTCNINTTLCFMTKRQERLYNFTKGRIHKFKHDDREKNFYFVDILQITPQYLYEFAAVHHVEGKERQTYLYLDECVAIFSPTCPTMQDLKLWEEWQTFFRMSRQLGYEVILIPQSSKLISRKVVDCCDLDVRHFAQKNHGTAGFFISLFLGGVFTAYTFWRGDRRECQSQKWYRYKPLYGQMYNSYTLFEGAIRPYKEALQWQEMLKEEEEERKAKLQEVCKLVNVLSLAQQIFFEYENSQKFKIGGERNEKVVCNTDLLVDNG